MFKPLSLRNRIVLTPAICVLLTLILHLASNTIIRSNTQLMKQLNDSNLSLISELSHLSVELNNQHARLSSVLIDAINDPDEETVYLTSRGFYRTLNKLEGTLAPIASSDTPIFINDKNISAAIATAFQHYKDASNGAIELSTVNAKLAQRELNNANQAIQELNDFFLVLSEFHSQELAKNERLIDQSLSQYENLSLAALIALLFMAGITWIFSTGFSKGLDQINSALIRLANAESITQIPVQDDAYLQKLASAVHAFNATLECSESQKIQLNELVDELKQYQQELEMQVEKRTHDLQDTVNKLTDSQQETEAAEHKAIDASKAKSEFLAHMSHELRTPMNGIIAMAELLASSHLDQEHHSKAVIIKDSATALLVIINDILDISKIEAGKLELDRHEFPLSPLLESISAIFSSTLDKKNITFTLDTDRSVPDLVFSDSDRLRQVLINLIGNAIKFSHNKGRVQLRIKRKKEDLEQLHFAIEDNGIGIPKDRQANIFEAFTQADTSITRQFGGTGLGLRISQKLVQLLGGEVYLNSEEGQGTTIGFNISIKPTENPSRQTPDKDSSLTAAVHKKAKQDIRILIAEDNTTNQIVARALLKKLGYDCDIVDNGQEAIKYASRDHYDIILMDCQMPIMDGWKATQCLRENKDLNHIPIIAMTAGATHDERDRCRAAGMDDFISKPITMAAVRDTLAKWH